MLSIQSPGQFRKRKAKLCLSYRPAAEVSSWRGHCALFLLNLARVAHSKPSIIQHGCPQKLTVELPCLNFLAGIFLKISHCNRKWLENTGSVQKKKKRKKVKHETLLFCLVEKKSSLILHEKLFFRVVGFFNKGLYHLRLNQSCLTIFYYYFHF